MVSRCHLLSRFLPHICCSAYFSLQRLSLPLSLLISRQHIEPRICLLCLILTSLFLFLCIQIKNHIFRICFSYQHKFMRPSHIPIYCSPVLHYSFLNNRIFTPLSSFTRYLPLSSSSIRPHNTIILFLYLAPSPCIAHS